ncbi:MAG: hypothetical protein JXA73_18625 [Acidobacteria bacterium]|nr:hypothetical protein [Acidobacteriota bacterium]
MMTGLAIENAEAISLDSKNNSYDGPGGLFRIVVDSFDGNAIRSWHIEDKYGEKSRNLGDSQCKSLDTIVGEVGLYLGGQVMTNVYGQALNNLNWTKPKYVNKLIQEIKRLKSTPGGAEK